MTEWFTESWRAVDIVVLSTIAFYVVVVVMVRLAGRRTLAQLSAFDVIVTVALGSLLANTITAEQPSFGRNAAALITLLAMQVVLGWLRRRSPTLMKLVEFEPLRVVEEGKPHLDGGPFGPQLTETELESGLRKAGVFDIGGAALVILEPTGGFSVRPAGDETHDSGGS